MRLDHIETGPSPLGPHRVRLSGELTYRTPGRPSEGLWFDVEERIAPGLARNGNPWLAALLPLAVTLGEPLQLPQPVDAMLREGAEALMRVWSAWHPAEYQPVSIECDVTARSEPDVAGRTATLFSGGVDSFYTLLRHAADGPTHDRLRIDDLVTVWGLDIPLREADGFATLRGSVETVAESVGTGSVTIATNLRESGWRSANWGRIAQGPALAAVALVLEERFRRVLFPSSIPYQSFKPWGTHPLVDPLLSTSRTEIRNDGALARRHEKVAALIDWKLAMQHLRVCWAGQSAANCGACEKCLRTLASLEMLDAGDRALTFPPGAWSLQALGNLKLRQDLDREAMERIAVHAQQHGRRDIARAASRAIRRYDVRRQAVRLARAVGLR